MTAIDEVERFFRHLVDVLSQSDPDRLNRPIQVSEIYQSVLPYRHHRSALGFDTNEDYEMAVLRFLAGDGGFASLDPPEVQDALAHEAQSVNPNPGAFREYAAARVYLNSGAVRTVTEAREAYAPPPEVERDTPPDEFDSDEPGFEEQEPFAPDPDVLDITTAKMPGLEAKPAEPPEVVEDVPPNGSSCAYCGASLPAGREVKYCPYCGHDLRVVSCPSCGEQAEAGWRYCITCGDPLEG